MSLRPLLVASTLLALVAGSELLPGCSDPGASDTETEDAGAPDPIAASAVTTAETGIAQWRITEDPTGSGTGFEGVRADGTAVAKGIITLQESDAGDVVYVLTLQTPTTASQTRSDSLKVLAGSSDGATGKIFDAICRDILSFDDGGDAGSLDPDASP
jgi:hypothetical protein